MRRKQMYATGIALAALMALSACGGKSDDAGASKKQLRIAVLVGGASNSYQSTGVTGMKKIADKLGVKLTVFDGGFDSPRQYGQLQAAITSGNFDGVVINPVDGSGIVPLVKQAVKAGVKIASWNQPIGSDLTTAEPTVDGVTAQAMVPVADLGALTGDLVTKACADVKADPCQVARLNFSKGSPFDTANNKAMDDVLAKVPSIKLVVEADSQASREGGRASAQTILTSHPDVDVIVGLAQSIVGALPEITSSPRVNKIRLVASGMTRQAADAMKKGEIFAGAMTYPVEEAQLALEQLVKAIRGETYAKAVNPKTVLKPKCADGVTQENVATCSFEYDG